MGPFNPILTFFLFPYIIDKHEDSRCPSTKIALGDQHAEIWGFGNSQIPYPILMIAHNTQHINSNTTKDVYEDTPLIL